jgi:carbonic anhydrase/acetyltransferase-like protein (isoleucine patch superfamily)
MTPLILTLAGATPEVADDAWVAPGATLAGAVTLGPSASVWYGAVLRADGDRIEIGPQTNLQDGCTVHTDRGFPVRLGRGVSVGHQAVIHGATVGDNVLVGMGAIIMNGAVIGDDVLVAAGAVVPEGADVPARSLVAGVPGKVRRSLADAEVDGIRGNAATYLELMELHRAAAGA